jgi:ATP-binding cassette, subfamily B, bacterial
LASSRSLALRKRSEPLLHRVSEMPAMLPSMPASPLSRLLRYTRAHRRALTLATLYSVLNKLFDLAPPVLIGAAVDIVISRQNSFVARLGVSDTTVQLWVLAALTLGIWAAESLFEYFYELKWRGLAQTVQHQLRMDAYAHVQSLQMGYLEDQSTGGLLAILNDDVNQLERFLDSGANQLIQLATTILVVGGMFLGLVPSVAWMAIVPMPLVIWGSVRFQKKLEPRYAKVRQLVSSMNSELANNLSGITTIKSFVAKRHEEQQVEAESRAYENANREAIRLSSAFVPLIRMVIVVGFAAIMIFGGQLVLAGQLNVGVYSVLVFMTQRLLWPLTGLGTMLDQYQRAMASTTRVLDLLQQQKEDPGGRVILDPRNVRGEIEVQDVSFDYGTSGQARPTVLDGLNVHVPAGQTVAFVGSTGAGKSTLIKLLLRLYDVKAGHIRLDGHDLKDLTLDSLRRSIGLVSQDVFLFHGSVRENIAYGTFDATQEQIIEAAKIAEAHDFISGLHQGYDTIVGERGQKLSGGQRQRISIARAVLKDPPVLILDEATSSVDNETEAAIQRSLARLAVGRTTLIVAHRLSTVRRADHTYVLEQGRVREEGTHDSLLAAAGSYAQLWNVQTGVMLHPA